MFVIGPLIIINFVRSFKHTMCPRLNTSPLRMEKLHTYQSPGSRNGVASPEWLKMRVKKKEGRGVGMEGLWGDSSLR